MHASKVGALPVLDEHGRPMWILTRTDVAPFVGLGGGLRWTYSAQRDRVIAGRVIALESNDLESDSAWGPGAFGRLGLLFFRTYSVRVVMSAAYDVTFIDLGGEGVAQAAHFGIGVLF